MPIQQAELLGIDVEDENNYFGGWTINTPSTFTGDDSQINSSEKNIKSWNYKPKFNFHKVSKENELYLGCEIEVDKGGCNEENAGKVLDIVGEENVYIVTDGSLENGFEIVTHPMTYEYHLNKMPYMGMFDSLTGMGYRAHDTQSCGLHIHFNRDYFGKDKLVQDMCISKLLYIFEKFFNDIQIIARRGSNRYAQRYSLSENESVLDLYAKAKDGGKYRVINLNNSKTVEIRIFKGTLNYNTFINTLKFVKEVVEISKSYDIYKLHEINWDYILKRVGFSFEEYYNERKIKFNKKQKEIKQRELENSMRIYNGHMYYHIPRNIQHNCDFSYDLSNSLRNLNQRISNLRIEENQREETEDERNIRLLKQQIKSERNPMRKQQLQRQLSELQRDISIRNRRR